MQFTGDSTAQTALKMADTYMASGHWEAAESLLREYCTNQADLTLRLAQLEWRRQCVEYASELGRAALDGSCGLFLAARR